MRKLLFLVLVALFFFSCKKKDAVTNTFDNMVGTYQTMKVCTRDSAGIRVEQDTTYNVTVTITKVGDSILVVNSGYAMDFFNDPTDPAYTFVNSVSPLHVDVITFGKSLKHFNYYHGGGFPSNLEGCTYYW